METKTLEEKLLDLWTINDIIRDEEGNITQIYLKDDFYGIVACITYPHEGNNNKFMMRADFIRDFDRWDNVSCEVFFDEESDVEVNPDNVYELLLCDDFAYDEDDWEED